MGCISKVFEWDEEVRLAETVLRAGAQQIGAGEQKR